MKNLEKIEGVSEITAGKLLKSGFKRAAAIAKAVPEDLAKECDMDLKQAKLIINSAKEHVVEPKEAEKA